MTRVNVELLTELRDFLRRLVRLVGRVLVPRRQHHCWLLLSLLGLALQNQRFSLSNFNDSYVNFYDF